MQQKWVQTLLRAKGWIVPNYELAPDLQDVEILRVVVRESVTADKEIEAARTETDPKKQVELWQEAQKLIVADVCAVPLTETSQAWARTEKLEWGFELKGSLSLGPLLTEQASFKD